MTKDPTKTSGAKVLEMPRLRPRSHREAHGQPAERRAHRLVVLAGDHDGIAHVGDHRLHAPAHDRFPAELEQ